MISNPDTFRKWLRHARRGDRFCYYEGFLMLDRGNVDNKDTRTEDQNAINYFAGIVWDAAKKGAVSLTQKRRGKCSYSYYAQKR